MTDTYTLKEIMEKSFSEINNHLLDIKAQVTNTTGRVSSLEHSRIQIWTAISVSVFLVGTITYLFILSIEAKIDKGVASALSNYEKIEK